jgi:hypothetical protein
MSALLDGQIKVEIAPGADPADPTTWDFVDITGYDGIDRIRYADGIDLAYGVRNEGGYCDPSTCALTIDNRDGVFSSRNRLGPLYGGLTKNTPLQVTIGDQDALPAVAVRSVATHESGTTDAFNVTAPAGLVAGDVLVAFHTNDFGSTAQMGISGGAAWQPLAQATIGVEHANTRVWWKVAGGSEPATYGFTQHSNADAVVAIVAVEDASEAVPTVELLTSAEVSDLLDTPSTDPGTARLELRWVGANSVDEVATTFTPPAGFAELADLDSDANIAGSLAERDLTSSAPTGVHSFLADQDIRYHNGVTVNLSNAPTAAFVGFVPEWPVDWNPAGTADSFVRITAQGTLYRVQKGAKPLHSATRRVAQSNPAVAAYWPMEDGSGATRFESPIPGVRAIQPTGDFSPAAQEGPGGSKPLPVLRPGMTFFGQVPNVMNSNGPWLVEWMFYMEAPAVAGTHRAALRIRTTSNAGAEWVATVSSTQMRMLILDGDGSQTFNQSVDLHPDFYGRWVKFAMQATQVNPTTAAGFLTAIYEDSTVANSLGSASISLNEVGRPVAVGYMPLAATPDSRSAGHIAVGPLPGFSLASLIGEQSIASATTTSIDGWNGEHAADRFIRICAENNIPAVVRGNPAESEPMGAQLPKTLPELLREIEDTDGGRVHEIGTGLGYLTRTARYNQAVAMHIDADQMARTPRPTDDDLPLANQVEVTRQGGSSAIARNEPSIAADGLADREHPVNTHTDNLLQDIAGWQVWKGTHDGYRWPLIPVELHRPAAQALIPTWQAIRIGDRVTADHAFTQLPNVGIDVQVEGWRQRITQFTWDVSLYTVPDATWQLGQLGAGRYGPSFGDTFRHAAPGPISDSQTTITFEVATAWVNSTDNPELFPFLIEMFPAALGGRFGTEIMQVTAALAPVGDIQEFTVVRGVNGVQTAHPVGTVVMLVDPLRYAL